MTLQRSVPLGVGRPIGKVEMSTLLEAWKFERTPRAGGAERTQRTGGAGGPHRVGIPTKFWYILNLLQPLSLINILRAVQLAGF